MLERGSVYHNDTNALMVLSVLIKSSCGVDVYWRAPRFSSWRWKLNLLMLYLCHKRLILLATEEPLPSIPWRSNILIELSLLIREGYRLNWTLIFIVCILTDACYNTNISQLNPCSVNNDLYQDIHHLLWMAVGCVGAHCGVGLHPCTNLKAAYVVMSRVRQSKDRARNTWPVMYRLWT